MTQDFANGPKFQDLRQGRVKGLIAAIDGFEPRRISDARPTCVCDQAHFYTLYDTFKLHQNLFQP